MAHGEVGVGMVQGRNTLHKSTHYLLAATLALLPIAAQCFCYEAAGQRQQVNPCLLKAIAAQESAFNSKVVRPPYAAGNKDGSTDYGLMQINSSHLKRLAAYGVTADMLLNDPCVNVHWGAWVLAQFIKKYGNTWEAVGAYNASTPAKRYKYVKGVQAHYAKYCI